MNLILKNFTMLTTIIVLSSCGGGVENRPISTSNNQTQEELTLTPIQIDALAELKIAEELEKNDIDYYYGESQKIFTLKYFTSLHDLLSIECKNSSLLRTLKNFIDYGKLIHDSASRSNVVTVVDDALLAFNAEEQSSLSPNNLAVHLKSIEKLNQYRVELINKATVCKSVTTLPPEPLS